MTFPEKWLESAPRLRTLAKWMHENTELGCIIETGYSNTDRKVGRLRIPGKKRQGNLLKVFSDKQQLRDYVEFKPVAPLLSHNASETYRCNREVVNWLGSYLRKLEESQNG